jgi:CxxC-x17-CxxC domain-containing protein
MEGFNRGGRGFGGGNRGFGGGGRGGGFQRRRFDDGPREMHKATCTECKKECEVPFKPTEGKPVFCKECYFKKKNAEDGGSGFRPRFERPAQAPAQAAEGEGSGDDFADSQMDGE